MIIKGAPTPFLISLIAQTGTYTTSWNVCLESWLKGWQYEVAYSSAVQLKFSWVKLSWNSERVRPVPEGR